MNSWGTTFGVEGHFFMSSTTLTRLLSEEGDITSLVPLSQPAPLPTPSLPVPPTASVGSDPTAWGAYVAELRALAGDVERLVLER